MHKVEPRNLGRGGESMPGKDISGIMLKTVPPLNMGCAMDILVPVDRICLPGQKILRELKKGLNQTHKTSKTEGGLIP